MSDYIPELSSLAESRALELIATALPALDEKLALPSPEYPAVDGAPATELPALLGQLIRRGLQRPSSSKRCWECCRDELSSRL